MSRIQGIQKSIKLLPRAVACVLAMSGIRCIPNSGDAHLSKTQSVPASITSWPKAAEYLISARKSECPDGLEEAEEYSKALKKANSGFKTPFMASAEYNRFIPFYSAYTRLTGRLDFFGPDPVCKGSQKTDLKPIASATIAVSASAVPSVSVAPSVSIVPSISATKAIIKPLVPSATTAKPKASDTAKPKPTTTTGGTIIP